MDRYANDIVIYTCILAFLLNNWWLSSLLTRKYLICTNISKTINIKIIINKQIVYQKLNSSLQTTNIFICIFRSNVVPFSFPLLRKKWLTSTNLLIIYFGFFSLILWYSMWHLHKNNIVYFLQVCHVDKSHHTILVQTYTICMDVWMNVDMYYICMYIHMYVCNNKHIIAYKVLKKKQNYIYYTLL